MSGHRTVAWFSAGAASAVATRIAVDRDPDTVVAYCDPGSEHPDNQRFIADCETWIGRPIVQLRSDRYRDTWQVWEERRFLVGPAGTLCTVELKKRLRQQFTDPDDVQVFGYTAEEQHRVDRFREANPDVRLSVPLIDRGLTKADCLAIIERAGIEPPAMYRLGFPNANCVGCPHGGMGYWNQIRRTFPDVFNRMARLERNLERTCIRADGAPVFLDELEPDRGASDIGIEAECSLLCAATEADFSESIEDR